MAILVGALVAAGIVAVAAYGLVVRSWHLMWGATGSEVAGTLQLKAGDVIPLEPGGHGPPVAAIEPGRSLVLGGRVDAANAAAFGVTRPEDAFVCSWTFVLAPAGNRTTRLIERFRLDYSRGLRNTLFYRAVLEPGSFVIERKMLLGIRERAERPAASTAP